jgi:hypothetical protein
MRLIRSLVACAVMLAVPVSLSLALDGPNGGKAAPLKGGKRDQVHATRGVVVALKRDGDNDNGSITVRIQEKEKSKGKTNG